MLPQLEGKLRLAVHPDGDLFRTWNTKFRTGLYLGVDWRTVSDLWSSILLPLLSLSVKFPDGRIRLYCKGADTVIYERLSPNSRHKEATQTALDVSFHGFILICTAVYSQMICMYVAICLGSVKGNTACVFCASGLCQRDLADAVLVLQRHQHWRVRSLVQETQRSPGGHERQRCCSRPCVWADREQPVGGWKTNKSYLFSCLTKFEFGKQRKWLLITEITTARAFKKSNWKTGWSPLLLTESLVFFCWNSLKVQTHDPQPYLSSCVPLCSWLGRRPSRTNCRTECQTPSPHWPRLTSRSGSWLETRKVPSPNSPERSHTVGRSAWMSQYDIQQCKNTNG